MELVCPNGGNKNATCLSSITMARFTPPKATGYLFLNIRPCSFAAPDFSGCAFCSHKNYHNIKQGAIVFEKILLIVCI